jgi:very-short-patch-repair endonuclease
MALQPSKNKTTNTKKKKKPIVYKRKTVNKQTNKNKFHPKYGTSKLEDKFATNFLDKLGVKYVRQFEAKDIKRFYDFYLPDNRVLIEVDGDYYHSYGKVYEEMSPMQKKNARVDKLKNTWALMRGIPILRIWEHDINNNPEKVMKLLKETIGYSTKVKIILDNKKKRH